MSRKDMALRLKAVKNLEVGEAPVVKQAPRPPTKTPPPVVELPVEAAGPRAKRGIIQRQDGRVRRRRTAYFEPEVDLKLRLWCEENGHEASVIINQAVRQFLEQRLI